MTPEEMSDLYIRIAFHYESTVDRLAGKGLLDQDFVDSHRKTFYDSLNEEKLRASQKIRSQTEIMQHYVRAMACGDMVSLTKIAKQYTEDSPGYVIQSWMRSRNTLAPASEHAFLPIVSLGGDENKYIPWGATIPDEEGNYYYTSFSPAGYFVPWLFIKVFRLEICEKS